MHDMYQKVAFRTALENDLNTFRFVLDTAPCYSGLKRQGKIRQDEGALHWSHGKKYFGRQWANVTLSDGGLIVYGRPLTPRDEGILARKILIPTLKSLSDNLKVYAAEHGDPDHLGFFRAGLFGDCAFSDVETANVAYRNDFEPGFTSLEAGKPRTIIGKKHVQIKGHKGAERKYENLDMDNRGNLYCSCDEKKPLTERRWMEQVPNRFGRDFLVHCEHCPKRNIFYRVGRRGPEKDLKNGRWQKGKPSTHIRTLRHDDPRVIALGHLPRELHESRHSGFSEMGLLGKGRGGKRKHITGNLRHDFWYALGATVQNLVINHNFAAGRVSREALDWDDVAANGIRNGWAARTGKKRRADHVASAAQKVVSAAQKAADEQRKRNARSAAKKTAAKQGRRNAHSPPARVAA